MLIVIQLKFVNITSAFLYTESKVIQNINLVS